MAVALWGDMREDTFKSKMMAVHESFEARHYRRAHSEASALRQTLQSESGCDAEQAAWATYYELKSLHALEDWAGLRGFMLEHGALMEAAGATNHSFVCSLTMEACYRLGDAPGVAEWCFRCCEIRLGHDEESFGKAITSGRNLLEALERRDLLVELFLRLSTLGIGRRVPKLAVSGQTLALEIAAQLDDEATLRTAQAQLVDNGSVWISLSLEAGATFARLEAYLEDPKIASMLQPDVRATLEHGSAMFEAASAGDVEGTLARLEAAGDPNLVDKFGRTALSAAAFAGHLPLVDRLLGVPGIELNRANVQRRAPLAQAADQGHVEIVRRLLAAGADPDQPDFNEQTPLIIAAWQDHADVVCELSSAGARLELRDRTDNGALHLAATENAASAVEALIEAGAEIDATTELGHTPLMKAAMEGKIANVELLLAAGAQVDSVDIYGLSAQDWARREGFERVAQRLGEVNRGHVRSENAPSEGQRS